tara:strand:+ start:25145 stop:26608 length:1464 start_codon:yes stop_codon:yes gene_type:complete
MAFAYAPFSQAWLVFFLLQPLWVAASHPEPNTRIWRGLLFGLGYFSIGAYWFVQTLREHLDYSWPIALGAHLLITGACALAPTTFCWLGGYLKAKAFPRLLALAALWIVIEDIRFQAFGGGPWLSLGLSQIDMPLAGLYAIFGEVGTSYFVAIIVGLIAFAVIGDGKVLGKQVKRRRIAFSMGLVFLIMLLAEALKHVEWTASVGKRQAVALVQTAVSQQERKNLSSQADRLESLASLTEPFLGKAKFIIWPETVVTLDRQDVNKKLETLNEKAMFARSTILMGAYEPSMTGMRYNTAFTLGYEFGQTYRKRHLVPFGEYVPRLLTFLNGHVPGDVYRNQGRSPSLIANSGTLYGISICWEGSFSRDIVSLTKSGAHVLVNIANEAWFSGSSLPDQNLDAMRVRAIENGRFSVRVANFGPGAIIDEKGQLSAMIPAGSPSSTMGYVQPRIGMTPFILLGEDLITVSALLMIVIIVLRSRRKHKSSES